MKLLLLLLITPFLLPATPHTEWNYHWQQLKSNPSYLSISHYLILNQLNQYAPRPEFKEMLFTQKRDQLLESLLDPIRAQYNTKINAGWVDHYAIIGPFDQEKSFTQKFAPEQHPFNQDQTFKGKNQQVHWKNINGHHYRGYIDLKNFLNAGKDIVGYLVTDLHVKKEGIYQIRLGTGSRLTLFLNNHQIFHKKHYSKSGYDQYIFQGKLSAGIHRIMIKLDAKYEWGTYLRILDHTGKATPDITATTPSSKINPAFKSDFKLHPYPHPEATTAEILIRRGLFENHFFTGDREQHPYPGELFFEKALKKSTSPLEKGFINYYHGMYSSKKNLWEQRMLAAQKNSILPAIYDLMEQNLRDGYLHLVKKSLKRYQNVLNHDYRFHLLKLKYLQQLGLGISLNHQKIPESFPEYYHFILNQFRFQNDRKKLIKLHLQMSRFPFYKSDHWSELFSLLIEDNQFKQYQKLLLKRLKRFPYHYTYNLQWLKLLISQKRYQEALTYFDKHESVLRDAPEMLKLTGKIYQYLNDHQNARKFYENYLKLKPSDSTIAKFLSHQTDQKIQLWAEEYLREIEQKISELKYKIVKNTPATILYDHTVIKLHSDYSYNLFNKYAIQINNRELLPHYKIVPIYYQSDSQKIVHARVNLIKKSGDIIEIPRYKNRYIRSKQNGAFVNYARRNYTINNLEAGDTIEVSYYLDDRNRYQNPFFGKIFKLQGRLPSKVKTVMVLPATDSPLRDNFQATKISKKKLYIFPDQKEILPESGSTGYTSNYPYLILTTQNSWNEVIEWYQSLLKGTNQVPESIRKEIIQHTKNLTPLKKIEWIQEYVLKKTHYVGIELGINSYKPFPVHKVLERKFGDCKDKANLFNALLNVAGIKATMVLVRTARLGALPLDIPPSPRYFNHAISYIPSLNRFVDGTAELNGLNALPGSDQNAMALLIESGETLRKIPPQTSEESVIIEAERVGNDLKAVVNVSISGSRGARFRYIFQNPKKRIDAIESSMAYLGKITISNLTIKNLEEIQKELQYRYNLKVKDFFKKDLFKSTLLLRDLSSKMRLLQNRHSELKLPFYTLKERILLKGFNPEKLPPGHMVSHDSHHFKQTFTRSSKQVIIENTLHFKKTIIPPDQYKKWRQNLLMIDQYIKKPLFWSK